MSKNELQILKRDYWSKLFPTSALFLFIFLFIFIYSGLNQDFGILFIALTFLDFLLILTFFYILTKKHRLDLKLGQIIYEKEIVEDKVYKLDYEAGSATVPINLFSLLFYKKVFLREMKELHIYYIVINGDKIFLDKIDYDKAVVGDPILIKRTKNTRLFLGIDNIRE